MAIAVRFTPSSLDAAQYDGVVKQLENIGKLIPAGRLYHVCYGTGSNLSIIEVWESMDAFAAFGATLMPILQQAGIDPGQPEFSEVHNIIA